MITAEATRLDVDEPLSPVDRLAGLVADDIAVADLLIHERMGSSVALIPDLARHLVDSGGKRLRPLLTLASARLCGYQGSAHVKLAAAVEFIHTATLLHDDVVDASSLRRGKLAANIVWGNKPSILVGDFLFSRAFQLMVEAGSMRVLDILADASAVIAEGEVMQLKADSNLATTESRLPAHHRRQDRRVVLRRRRSRRGARGQRARHRGGVARLRFKSRHRLPAHRRLARLFRPRKADGQDRRRRFPRSQGHPARSSSPISAPTKRRAASGPARSKPAPSTKATCAGPSAMSKKPAPSAKPCARARRYADQASRSLAILPNSDLREALEAVAEFCVGRGY